MAQLPVPVRAALGLVATVADAVKDGRGLPDGFVEGIADKALELPVLAVSTALQASLRAQQRYAALTVRGDELLSALRGGPPEEPPTWAQFDDESEVPLTDAGPGADPEVVLDPLVELAPPVSPVSPVKKAAAKRPSKVAAAKAAAPAETVPTNTAPPKTVPAKKAPAKARAVPAPRTGRPSAFDRIGGDQP